MFERFKYLELFEDFKFKNITQDDIIRCIKRGGFIYATIVKNYPDNDPKEPMRAVSIDDDGLITVEIDGSQHEVDLKNVKKIDF